MLMLYLRVIRTDKFLAVKDHQKKIIYRQLHARVDFGRFVEETKTD